MKRNRGFGAPEDIDILSYVLKLKQYWRSFLLAFVIGICGGYYILLKSLPSPSTQAVLEIGFPEIGSGKYPNGNRFDKNDLISTVIIRKAVDAIPELGKSGRWSLESLSHALVLSPVYPLEIQLAVDALSRSAKLSPSDVVANYEKINSYYPSKFTISFHPAPSMPMTLQKKFLEELIKQYSTFVLESRIPLSLHYFQAGQMTGETDNVAAYGYLAAALEEIDDQIATVAKRTSISAINFGGAENVKQSNRVIGNDDEFMRSSTPSNSLLLQKIKMEMASIEHLIFNEKTVSNLDEFRNKLVSDISLLSAEIDIKKRQAEYKISLARIPNEGAPTRIPGENTQKGNGSSTDNIQNVDKTIMGILLSYNSQYYSLMNETNVIFDDISRMEGKLAKLKEHLKLLDAIGPMQNGTFDARNKALSEHLKLVQGYFAAFIDELAGSTKAAYAGYRPPVANSSVMAVMASISLLHVLMAGCGAVLLVMVVHLAKIVISDAEAQRQAAFPAPQEIGGTPKVNIKK